MKTFACLAFLASAALSANAFTGRATFYTPGLNACGTVTSPSDFTTAVSTAYFEANRATVCGSHITLTYQGKSVNVEVDDVCPGCPALHDLDLSPAAFSFFAPLSAGLITPVTWSVVDD